MLLLSSCGGLTRTDDLWVMSPTSYQLLHSAIISFAKIQKIKDQATTMILFFLHLRPNPRACVNKSLTLIAIYGFKTFKWTQ